MKLIDFQRQFTEKIESRISIRLEDTDRYRVLHPFYFDDGDHFSIVLKKENDKWILTDEGDTLNHLSILGVEPEALNDESAQNIPLGISGKHSIIELCGELILEVQDNDFQSAFYNFVQALIQISTLSSAYQEAAKQTTLLRSP